MTQALTLSLDFAAVTDIGCRRSNNEDSYGYDADQHLYVVCDGMGGNAAGEVASSMAVRALIETFEASAHLTGPDALPIDQRISQAIAEANRAVYSAGMESPELHNMGTTLVCACLDGDRAVIGNVGDSRAYLVRSGMAMQITQDHSLLDEEIRSGNITPEMAATSTLQSVITRAIGVSEIVQPDLFAARLQGDDLLILASDGLTRYATPDDIARATAPGIELSAACQSLVDLAKARGGADNITCILLRAIDLTASDSQPASDTPAGLDG